MTFINLYYLLVAFSISSLIIPLVFRFLKSFKFFDEPNIRKVHNKDILTGGGTIIFLGVILSLVLISIFPMSETSTIFDNKLFLVSFLTGFIILFSMGIVDDKINIPAWSKFIIQIISCCLFISISDNYIKLDFLFPESYIISYILTLIFMLSVINAVNFIDGLDGLSSSLSIISLVSLSLILDVATHVNMIFILIGATFSFLIKNIRPASIFLGDSGSYILGYSISIFSVLFLSNQIINLQNLIYLFLIVGIPLCDIIYVFFRRLIKKQKIYIADKKHIHHQMLKAGISHKYSVIYLIFLQAAFSFVGLNLIKLDIELHFYYLIIPLSFFGFYYLFHKHEIKKNIFFKFKYSLKRKLTFMITFVLFFFIINAFYNFSNISDYLVISEIQQIETSIYSEGEFVIIFLLFALLNLYLLFSRQSNVILLNIFASIIALDFNNTFQEWIDLAGSYLWFVLIILLVISVTDFKTRFKLINSYNSVDFTYISFLIFLSLSSSLDLINSIYLFKVFLLIALFKTLSFDRVFFNNNLVYILSLISIIFFCSVVI